MTEVVSSSVPAPRVTSLEFTLDLLGAAVLWGGMYVVSAGTFGAIPPVTLGFLRVALGSAVLLIAFRGRLGFRRDLSRRIVASGAIVALTMALQFVGTSLTGGAEGALLTTTTPAFVLVFGSLLERQRVHKVAWLGVAVALVGVAIIAARNGGFDADASSTSSIVGVPSRLIGDLLLVGSAATWALFSSVGRPLVAAVGAFRAILQASCVAVLLIAPFAAIEVAGHPIPPLQPINIAAVAYLGIGSTAVAWSLWYRGYATAPPTVSAAAFFAQPIVGAALGVLVLGEVLGSAFLAGSALVLGGVLVIAWGERSR